MSVIIVAVILLVLLLVIGVPIPFAFSGVTIVLVEQNVKAALAIADRGAVLVEGSTRIVGTARDLADDPQVAALYLGQHRGGL